MLYKGGSNDLSQIYYSHFQKGAMEDALIAHYMINGCPLHSFVYKIMCTSYSFLLLINTGTIPPEPIRT